MTRLTEAHWDDPLDFARYLSYHTFAMPLEAIVVREPLSLEVRSVQATFWSKFSGVSA